jgi:hypothetical protein
MCEDGMKPTLLFAAMLLAFVAEARVTRIEITVREPLAGGLEFGAAGSYEKLRGKAYFEVDPADRRNSAVFDIDKAPRNASGKVEFSADIYVLRPVDHRKANGTLLVEVPNRGSKFSLAYLMNDVRPGGNLNNPSTLADTGNAFLMQRGYTLVWVGWSAGVPAGADRMSADFPIAAENGRPVTGMAWSVFFDGDGTGGTPFTRPLSGSATFRSYPAVSTHLATSNAELRVRPSDSSRTGGTEVVAGDLVPSDLWSFARCPDGPPGTPSTTDICVHQGFQKNLVYEITYTATGSPVSGLGYLTTRDFVSFVRSGDPDIAGNPNPVTGVEAVICH